MKTLFTWLLLGLPAMAANPTFESFDTNYFRTNQPFKIGIVTQAFAALGSGGPGGGFFGTNSTLGGITNSGAPVRISSLGKTNEFSMMVNSNIWFSTNGSLQGALWSLNYEGSAQFAGGTSGVSSRGVFFGLGSLLYDIPLSAITNAWNLTNWALLDTNVLSGLGSSIGVVAGTNASAFTNAGVVTISADVSKVSVTNEALNAAFDATNGWPWGALYDPLGTATTATGALSGVLVTRIDNSTNQVNSRTDGEIALATNNVDATKLYGTIAAGRMPALTGAITTSAGSVATSLGSFSSASLKTALTDESGASGGVAPFFTLTSVAAGDMIGWSGTAWTNGPIPVSGGGGNFSTNPANAIAEFYATVFLNGQLAMTNGTGIVLGSPGSGTPLKDGGPIQFLRSGKYSQISSDTNIVATGSGIMIAGTNVDGTANLKPIWVANSQAGVSNLVIARFTNAVGSATNIIEVHGSNNAYSAFDAGAGLSIGAIAQVGAGNLRVSGGFNGPTNMTATADMNKGQSWTNIGAAFTMAGPINVDTSKTLGESTLWQITNNTAVAVLVTAAANVHTYWWGTNVTGFYVTNYAPVWVQFYGGAITNAYVGPGF